MPFKKICTVKLEKGHLKKTDWTMKTQSGIPLFREVKIDSFNSL